MNVEFPRILLMLSVFYIITHVIIINRTLFSWSMQNALVIVEFSFAFRVATIYDARCANANLEHPRLFINKGSNSSLIASLRSKFHKWTPRVRSSLHEKSYTRLDGSPLPIFSYSSRARPACTRKLRLPLTRDLMNLHNSFRNPEKEGASALVIINIMPAIRL